MQKSIKTETNSNLETEPRFLTATEVSEVFFNGKLGYTRVLKMTRDGELPAVKQGKSYLYSWSALEKWAEENLNKPTLAHDKTFTGT